MLSPDVRTVALDALRPPAGYRLDGVVLTTYSLDLEVLLALPLAVLTHADSAIDQLLDNPLQVLEALRQAGERVQVFVDEAGIDIPRTSRPLYAALESCVHPVKAPNGGAFHPKLWLARFEGEDGAHLLRVTIASRNLTFDRSWDVALTSEAAPGRRQLPESRDLAELLKRLPQWSTERLESKLQAWLAEIAKEAGRTAFPPPEGFDQPVRFHGLGLSTGTRKPWRPVEGGSRLLAISPFVNRTALSALAGGIEGECTMISRSEALDALPDDAIEEWGDNLWVLSEAAAGEPDDQTAARASGLHAKLFAVEHGRLVSWFLGSANLTAAAFTGDNVEMMAALVASRRRRKAGSGSSIEHFLEGGFLQLCAPYQRRPCEPEDPELAAAAQALEQAREQLLRSELQILCEPNEEEWRWTLHGELILPDGVEASVWPVTVEEQAQRKLKLPLTWQLPAPRLTALVAFRLHHRSGGEDLRLAVKLPARGLPEGRINLVLRTLVDSPERFLQFLRALLGGLEGLSKWVVEGGDRGNRSPWRPGLGGETLLEDLLRTASREPQRLQPIRELVEDLRNGAEGRRIIPDDLYAVWKVVHDAVNLEEV
ncbi:phospholipase D family protein [Microbulbifer litoralis]|uniref:phospholipase D family protein n=1 Tax=Microbulbifer litoralis TaxID=2933965 RepID=UPI0020293B46|nr:phospholipase D family protein [Microbulbifer sp. GX H0434]